MSRRARLAWSEGRPPYRSAPAWLLDISERGALIRSVVVPELGTDVWVRLDGLPCEWVRSTVRGVRPDRSPSRWYLHLAFVEPCPAGLIEVALDFERDDEADPGPEPALSHGGSAIPLDLSLWFATE
jgi:hypothetical protein